VCFLRVALACGCHSWKGTYVTSRRRFCAALVSATLVAGVVEAVAPPALSEPPPNPPIASPVTSRPDLISARIAAASQGSRVEVTSLDTESSTTWVNPDGTITRDIGSGPIQAQDANGNWQPLDDSLQERANGTVIPAVSVTDVVFAKGGSSTAAKLGPEADSAAIKWEDPLPAPDVSGETATYPDVLPGTDLTAKSNPTGFELSLVVGDLTAAAALPDTIDLPLASKGLTWSIDDAGVLVGKDASGNLVVSSAGANAWDATRDDHTDQPLHSTKLSLSLSGNPGAQVLHVATPRDLLANTSTVFPVTIDPSATWSTTAWTYVDSSFPATSYFNSAGPARVGTFNSGSSKNRTIYRFDTSGLAGKDIISATFKVFENWSWSCTARAFDIWGIPDGFSSGTTWNNQPALGAKRGTITAAKGYSTACPAGNVSTDITGWAQYLANGNGNPVNNALELRSQDETDNTYWKKFDTSATISLTYNSYPGTAGSLSVAPCSAQCSGTVLTDSATPKLTGKTSDADGGNLRYDFQVWNSAGTTQITSGSKSAVTSGSTATWSVPSGNLTNGTTYKYRVRAWDGTDYGAWSNWLSFKVDTTKPATPALSSTAWTAGTWSSPTSGTITWSDTSTDVANYSWQLDSGNWSGPTAATSKSLSNLTNNTEHTFSVKASDTSGNVSTIGSFTFGIGTGGLTSPNYGDRTQRSVTLAADGPQPYVAYQWRRGYTATWANIPLAQVTDPTSGLSPAAWPVAIGRSWNWDVATTAGNSDGLIEIRACLYVSMADVTPTCQNNPVDVQLVSHTFGASYATEPIGPGDVSLLTGDFEMSAVDADITAGNSALSLSRTLTTLGAPTAPSQEGKPTGVFGPGWTASLDGPVAGVANMTATIASDKSQIVLTDADGGSLDYKYASSLTISPISYTGVGAAADGSTLSYAYALATPTLSLTDIDGTVTTWTQQSGQWVPQSVKVSGQAGQNIATYYYGTDGAPNGLPSRIVSAPPAGVNCDTAANAAANGGCRSLVLGYTSMTVSGTVVQRLASVSLNAWNPSKTGGAGMDTVQLAAYDYDGSGRLAHAWDPRITPSLKATYTYDSNGRLLTFRPPGQAAWTLGYDTTGCPSAPSCGRLITASRPDPSGLTATTTIVYGVPLSGTGLPDLTSSATASWGQDTDLTPQAGTPASAAIFAPDHVPAGTSSGAVASTDWPYAAITYMDVNGRAVDTAQYGSGDWQIDSTRYDAQGNQAWSLTAGNRAQALNPTGDTDAYVAALPNSDDRADALATISTYNTDGTELTDQQGPTHPVMLANGSTIDARTHTATCYDDMACNPGGPAAGGPYYLTVSTTLSALGLDGVEYDSQTSQASYAGTTPNGTTGWTLRQPTSQTDAGGLVTQSRYDDEGRLLEQRLPGDAAGTTPRTTEFTYYTATGTGACANAAFAGLLCSTAPAAQPNTGSPLPVTTYVYNMYGDVTRTLQTYGTGVGATVRQGDLTYDAAQRLTAVDTTTSPEPSDETPIGRTTFGYDPSTGLQITATNGSTVLTTGYDNLGRVTSYTDASGNRSTRSYDIDGRPTQSYDGKGTSALTYDSSTEQRGLATSEDLGLGTGAPSQVSISYDAGGAISSVMLPNGLQATLHYDNAGNLTTLTYTKDGITWLSFENAYDVMSRVAVRGSPGSTEHYQYDTSARLSQVLDEHDGTCDTRQYTYDDHSNRTSELSYPADPSSGACSSTTTPSTSSYSYDAADRLQSPGYQYDAFGRTTTVPSVDALGAGDLTLTYYDNDMVASEQQAGITQSFQLDRAAANRAVSTTRNGLTTTYHFSDGGPVPDWQSVSDGTWQRTVPIANVALAVDQSTGASLSIEDLSGSAVATVADDVAATGPQSYGESTEFGISRSGAATQKPYGWLARYKLSSDDLGGIVLMNARMYNPATGRFLSVDPISGGSANAYDYCNQDPINHSDPSGSTWYFIGRHADYDHTTTVWGSWRLVYRNTWWDSISRVATPVVTVLLKKWARDGYRFRYFKVRKFYVNEIPELYRADSWRACGSSFGGFTLRCRDVLIGWRIEVTPVTEIKGKWYSAVLWSWWYWYRTDYVWGDTYALFRHV
jgi:RHS repeat-associated protein